MKAKVKTSAFAGERIAKVIARAGICSRRDAERMIAEGRVALNGKAITSAAVNVSEADEIAIDGKALSRGEKTRLWRYHKPDGLVVSHKDPQARATVFTALRARLPRVLSIGRLDIGTEGLLLLTNDGELARLLELPASGWVRRYRVRAFGAPQADALARLKNGITIDGIHYGPMEVALDKVKASNCWLTFAIREGKNREVKKVCEHLGLKVNRLIRTSFGPFELGNLARGEVEEVPTRMVEALTGKTPARKPDDADRRRKAQGA